MFTFVDSRLRLAILSLVLLAAASAPGMALAEEGGDGLTVPAADPAVVFLAPRPDQPNYAMRVQLFVEAVVPEPFKSTFNTTGGADAWGLPISLPSPDPNNPEFVYQRFENGVLFYNATEGTTEP